MKPFLTFLTLSLVILTCEAQTRFQMGGQQVTSSAHRLYVNDTMCLQHIICLSKDSVTNLTLLWNIEVIRLLNLTKSMTGFCERIGQTCCLQRG